jgi:hypothetical protein
MNTHHSYTDLLDLAIDFAERIRFIEDLDIPTVHAGEFLDELSSEEGFVIPEDEIVVWMNTENRTVVVWGGNNFDEDMSKLAEVKLDHDLYVYATGEKLRPATTDELNASVLAADSDGGRGVIEVDGMKVYAL